uniref:Uncharacterized protein n=1 Tax=Anguilla anguilla TaxID=7936 RepID=A0A0E9QCD3_ANGAN
MIKKLNSLTLLFIVFVRFFTCCSMCNSFLCKKHSHHAHGFSQNCV